MRDLVQTHGISVVHEPIPVSPKLPSLMYGIGAPVVIGPMNGGMNYPPGFSKSEGLLERWLIRAGRMLLRQLTSLYPENAKPQFYWWPTSEHAERCLTASLARLSSWSRMGLI